MKLQHLQQLQYLHAKILRFQCSTDAVIFPYFDLQCSN